VVGLRVVAVIDDWTAADPFEQRPFVRRALNLDPWLL
jgi:hypothetical protein